MSEPYATAEACATCGHPMVPSSYLDYLGIGCKNCGRFDVRECPQGISTADHEDGECYCTTPLSDEYTPMQYEVPEPTDTSVRESFMFAQLAVRGYGTNTIGTPLTVKLSAAFDRWLEAHDRQVKAEAWDEGARHGFEDYRGKFDATTSNVLVGNPYRKEGEINE